MTELPYHIQRIRDWRDQNLSKNPDDENLTRVDLLLNYIDELLPDPEGDVRDFRRQVSYVDHQKSKNCKGADI